MRQRGREGRRVQALGEGGEGVAEELVGHGLVFVLVLERVDEEQVHVRPQHPLPVQHPQLLQSLPPPPPPVTAASITSLSSAKEREERRERDLGELRGAEALEALPLAVTEARGELKGGGELGAEEGEEEAVLFGALSVPQKLQLVQMLPLPRLPRPCPLSA